MDTVRLVCYKKSYDNLEAFAKEAEGYGNYHLLFNSTTDIRSCEIDGKEAVFVLWDVEDFFGIGGSCILPVLRYEFSLYHRGYSFALLRDDGYEFLESYGDEFDGLLSIQKEIVRTIRCEGDV